MKDAPQEAAFYQQLGANIRKYRTRLELSQDALARLVGLTRTSLTNIENGRQHPPLHTFCEIVEQLKADVSELLPRPLTTAEPANVKAILGRQVRRENERAFIETGIGMKEKGSHGDTETKNSGIGRNPAS
jgi:transcriptional regulator with XRE-family HTH domain